MKIVGIDLGSRSVKIVTFVDEKMIDQKLIDTAYFYRNYCKNIDGKIEVDFEKIGIIGFDKIVSTGYGRNNININNSKKIVELKAHIYGAMWQTKLNDFVLLDVGGQDSKIILVKNGKMQDIILNDKCAASCGRYLENMSHVLGMSLEEMTKYSNNPVILNSTCAIFSESELIGKIAEGINIEELSAGVNYSLYNRIKPKLLNFSSDTLIVTGGVATNNAFIQFIKNENLYKEVIVPQFAQLNGAIGCAMYGFLKLKGDKK